MTITATHTVTATLHNGVEDVTLRLRDVEVTLDDGWAPYVQAQMTIVTPSAEAAELIDPRDGVRVSFTLANAFGSRDFDLTLHERTIDHERGITRLHLASDEKLLQDFALVASAPSTAARDYESSLRDIINNVVLGELGASLETDAGADFDCTIDTNATNLVRNPRLGTGTTDWSYYSATGSTSRQTSGGPSDAPTYFRLTLSASLEAAAGGIYMAEAGCPVTAGQTYTISAYMRCTASVNGEMMLQPMTASGGSNVGGPTIGGSTTALTANVWKRVVATITVPATATVIRLHFRCGALASGDRIEVTGVRATLSSDAEPTAYFDGDFADTDAYTYAWAGTAHASSSTRTGNYGRSPEFLTWEPGEKAWDFLEPLVQASGLRLYCDELRKWHLVDPALPQPGQINVTEAVNLTRAADTISRDAAWYDSVVIEYRWLEAGAQWVEYDVAGSGGNCLTLRYNRPYPGPGAAQAVLSRAQGKGRVLDIAGLANFSATPGMALQATLPDTPIQTGVISRVSWALPDGLMALGSRGLTDTPETAWMFLDAGEEWLDSPIGESWIEEVV